jgi:hypothetical protein
MKKIFGKSRGQMMVLYSGAIVALLGAVALGSDVALMYVNWQQAQKTADAAAIAGANYLTGIVLGTNFTVDPGCTGQPDAASQAACTYVAKNGLATDSESLKITEPTASSIKVVTNRTDPYYFAKVLNVIPGVSISNYNTSATAIAQGPGNIGTVRKGMFPVGLQCTNPCTLSSLDPGQSVSFGSKFVGGLAPGNWQWLSLGGTGASTLGTNIQNGASGSYSIGDTINSSPGNKGNSNPVSTGLADRFTACAAEESKVSFSEPCSAAAKNPTDIPHDDPCLVVVPAVDYHGCTGNCSMAIEAFALIYLDKTSSPTQIDGCFVSTVAKDTIASSTAPGLGGLVVDALTQ